MDNKTDVFIRNLIDQLTEIYDQTLKLFEQIQLKSYKELNESGDEVITKVLDPTIEQKIESKTIHRKYVTWSEVIMAFLGRQSQEKKSSFSQIVDLFSTYILFQRSGANITDQLWRKLFVQESGQIVLVQVEFINDSRDNFSLVKIRNSTRYDEFTLRFIHSGDKEKKYKVDAQCNLGEAENLFALPFDDNGLENFLLKYCQPRYALTRGWTPRAVRPLAEFGQKLFDVIISGEIRDLFFRARQQSESNQLGLRIKLRLKNTPELGDIPWEFIYDGRDFLCLSNTTPVTRYQDSTVPTRPLLVKPPFRLLVTTSSPQGWAKLDVEKEQEKIRIALAPLVALGILRIDFSNDGTLRTLQRMLRSAQADGDPYHIWHFVGHGMYNETESASVLIFENDKMLEYAVSGFELGMLFNSYPSLRLVILNACEGARTSKDNVLSGIGVALVERGMPAVIAMQFEITDTAAIMFTEEFYSALVDGLSVDAALSEARRSIFFLPNYVEWATPVLFMRVDDGVIFDVQNIV